jgi:hypothetical protein
VAEAQQLAGEPLAQDAQLPFEFSVVYAEYEAQTEELRARFAKRKREQE